MKILISADMQGITGGTTWDQVRPGHAEYARFRKLMTEDVNAAVRGAFGAGADEVLIADGHGAGFALMASLAVHDKASGDPAFEKFLPIFLREAGDDRNFVRQAVNCALRQIGKRNRRLHTKAVSLAKQLSGMDSRSAKWVGADALRKLQAFKVVSRIRK